MREPSASSAWRVKVPRAVVTVTRELYRVVDQLTAELRHFVDCVRTGRRPRVTGEDGREALALAERVLASVRSHSWDGRADGPTGPTKMPRPAGWLFDVPRSEAA